MFNIVLTTCLASMHIQELCPSLLTQFSCLPAGMCFLSFSCPYIASCFLPSFATVKRLLLHDGSFLRFGGVIHYVHLLSGAAGLCLTSTSLWIDLKVAVVRHVPCLASASSPGETPSASGGLSRLDRCFLTTSPSRGRSPATCGTQCVIEGIPATCGTQCVIMPATCGAQCEIVKMQATCGTPDAGHRDMSFKLGHPRHAVCVYMSPR